MIACKWKIQMWGMGGGAWMLQCRFWRFEMFPIGFIELGSRLIARLQESHRQMWSSTIWWQMIFLPVISWKQRHCLCNVKATVFVFYCILYLWGELWKVAEREMWGCWGKGAADLADGELEPPWYSVHTMLKSQLLLMKREVRAPKENENTVVKKMPWFWFRPEIG